MANRQTAYHRVTAALRSRILSGEWEAGEQLPTEAELCEEYGVSRITIRRALHMIEEEALVERKQGSGTYVSPAQQLKIPIRNMDFSDSVTRFAPDLDRRVVNWGWTEASDEIARILQQAPSARVLEAVRVDELNRRPVATDQLWVIPDYARKLDESHLAHLDFLEEWMKIEGLILDYCTQCVEAVRADNPLSLLLDVSAGEPLLRETNVVSSDGSPAGYFVTHYIPEMFRFEATVDIRSRRIRR